MHITFTSLAEVPTGELVALMNHPRLHRHLPLLRRSFTEADAHAFLSAKAALWANDGYGPWAVRVNGDFAGWGGAQSEGGSADLALVLHPDHWGRGAVIARALLREAFDRWSFASLTALLPRSRTRHRALDRMGFVRDGELLISGEVFLRFRLHRDRAVLD